MLKDNFTFMTDPYLLRWIKDRNTWLQGPLNESQSTRAEKTTLRREEEELAFRIKEFKVRTTTTWTTTIQHFSQSQKNVWFQDNKFIAKLKWIPEEFGRDLLVGKERFFSSPLWWAFWEVERGLILAQSVELFKQVGFIHYFLELIEAYNQKLMRAGARQEVRNAGAPSENNGDRVSLGDGMISETFMLFLYGAAIAMAGFASEIIAWYMTSVVSALMAMVSVLR